MTDYNILDYGAEPGSPVHEALNAAVQAAHEGGGGRVVVPPGRWSCGTFELRSCVELYLSRGAVLVPSMEKTDFPRIKDPLLPPHIDTKKEGKPFLLLARDCEEVAVTGPGCFDADAVEHTTRVYFTLGFIRCRGVQLENFTVRNAVAWTCLLSSCDEVAVRGVRMRNPLHTGDGFDVDGCRDVRISDCDIVTGDDCIVIKTCMNSRSSERIVISNCIFRTSCAGVKIGTETWHDVRQVVITGCVVHQSGRAVQIFSMDGATVEDVVVTGLIADTNSGIIFNRPIHIDCCRRRHGCLLEGVDHGAVPPGLVRNISISDCSLTTDGRILLTGSDRPLENISLRGIRMNLPWVEDIRRLAHTGDAMQTSNASPDARLAPAALVAKNIDGLTLRDFEVCWPQGPAPAGLRVKCEVGVPQIDPHNDTEPPVEFHALWLKNVRGRIDRDNLRSSGDGVAAVFEEEDPVRRVSQ